MSTTLNIDIDSLQHLHRELMPYMWTISMNVAILLSHYKSSILAIFLHVLIGLYVSIMTLYLALPLFLEFGIPEE